jgi:hypothetical protein
MLLLQSKADSTRDFSAANGLLILRYTQAVTGGSCSFHFGIASNRAYIAAGTAGYVVQQKVEMSPRLTVYSVVVLVYIVLYAVYINDV